MKPIIGIPVRAELDNETNLSMLTIYETLRRSIQSLGADIMLIAPTLDCDSYKTKYNDLPKIQEEDIKTLDYFLKFCDGIVIPGGGHYMPTNSYIIDYAIKNDVPLLGICFGMQEMSCYKEEFWVDKNINNNHKQSQQELYKHSVKIDKDSILYDILGKEEILVNSFHNYHVRPSKYYKAIAYSDDGLIEAITYPNNTFNLGVQWHPEKNIDKDENAKKLLEAFIKVVKNNKIYIKK